MKFFEMDHSRMHIVDIKMDDYEIALLRSILIARSDRGTTISEMRDEFNKLIGYVPDIFEKNYEEVHNELLKIPRLRLVNQNMLNLWYSESEKSHHITEMVINQKPEKVKKVTDSMESVKCFFKDNYKYVRQRKSNWWQKNSMSSKATTSDSSIYSNNSTHLATYFYGFELVGDDFFLEIASKRNNNFRGRRRIPKCGLCISGQTIQNLTNRIKSIDKLSENLIINIGSVDILHGRDLLDMQEDFVCLMGELFKRNINVIVTTIAPLANCFYEPYIRKKLMRFNQFIRTNFDYVIDLWTCFVNEKEKIIYDYYQPEAEYVVGSFQPHVLWNKIGRQNVTNMLKSSIADILYNDLY